MQGPAALREAGPDCRGPSAAVGPACWLHGEPCRRLTMPDEISELLHASGCENRRACCISGDTGLLLRGFEQLVARLQAQGYRACGAARPFQPCRYSAAAAGPPLAGRAKLVSAHGRACDAGGGVHAEGKPTFFLTGGSESPAGPSAAPAGGRGLWRAGRSRVGERPGLPRSRTFLPARRASWPPGHFDEPERAAGGGGPGAVPPGSRRACPTKPLRRGEVPMTKQEVRAAVLGKLGVQPGRHCSGMWAPAPASVSVELALAGPPGPGVRRGV